MFRERRTIGLVWEHEEMKKKAEGLEKSVTVGGFSGDVRRLKKKKRCVYMRNDFCGVMHCPFIRP